MARDRPARRAAARSDRVPLAPKEGCGRPAGRYGWAMEAVRPGRSRTVATIVLGLFVFPLLAVPLYAIGHIADDYDANGGFALGQLFALAPAVAAMVVARSWATWKWLPTVALSIACFLACGLALLSAFVIVAPIFGGA
jgi:O-antigen ligase